LKIKIREIYLSVTPGGGKNHHSKGANSRLVISSASDSESDKINQWPRWSLFFRSAIGSPIDQPPALLANDLS
jgi:hypothetical protein